jgi:hypothetical protein
MTDLGPEGRTRATYRFEEKDMAPSNPPLLHYRMGHDQLPDHQRLPRRSAIAYILMRLVALIGRFAHA